MSIGANIRKRRFELKMTQQELATAMGYSNRATIAKIESGENDVTHSKLQRFAIVLDTTVDALVSGSESIALPQDTPIIQSEWDDSIPRNKNVVVILAGGKSSRNLQNIPNQFITVLGKPVIVYCMESYQNHPTIDDIYVVCLKGWESIVKAYAEKYHITKLRGIIPAGTYGIRSVKNGFEYLKEKYNEDDIIIFQESTRPMVSVEMISKLLQACNALGSANICLPMRDHLLFSVSSSSEKIADRETTVEVQSPEAYKFSELSKTFVRAEKKKHPLTESCGAMLLYNLGQYVNFVEGSVSNVKIIRQEDVAIFTSLLHQSNLR